MSAYLVEAVLRELANNIALYSSRPHRMFRGPPEPIDKLHKRLLSLYQQSKYGDPDYAQELVVQYVAGIADELEDPNTQTCAAFAPAILKLIIDNKLVTTFPPLQNLDDAAQAQLRRTLEELEPYLIHEERIRDLFGKTVCLILLYIAQQVPSGRESLLSAPLHTVIDAVDLTERLLGTFLDETNFPDDYPASLTFQYTRGQLVLNILRVSKLTPEHADKNPQRLIAPRNCHLHGEDLLHAYLGGTPFESYLRTDVPIAIPTSAYREHGFLFAKSGHGKTQTLRALFASLLKEDCALFLIDGNGSLIENIDRIDGIQDRLIVLDPRDVPALNFYKLHGGSREKQMELFFYLFKAIEQGLTERQATMVSYLVDFMHAIPNSTLDTLREVCDARDLPYQEYLKDTPQITQDFFNKQFLSSDQLIKQTRSQIAARLYSLCRNQTFIDMFSAPENKFDAFKAMQERRIVIVDTTRNELGDHGSAIFGRFILAQCLAAAFQRPKNERHLALIICDEAKAYLDDQSQKILSDARAFGLGLLLASQFPDQLAEGVRKEVINNTSVKLAGPAAYSVVAQIHRDMRCQPEFILGMKKKEREGAEWACYVDNLTPQAIRLTVPFGTIERLPQLSDAEHAAFRAQNKERYGKSPVATRPSLSQPVPVTPPSFPEQSPPAQEPRKKHIPP